MEMKEAIVNAATQHLQRRRPVKKKWITADTLELIEEKAHGLPEMAGSTQ